MSTDNLDLDAIEADYWTDGIMRDDFEALISAARERDAMLALHVPIPNEELPFQVAHLGPFCRSCSSNHVLVWVDWPCPTIRVLEVNDER